MLLRVNEDLQKLVLDWLTQLEVQLCYSENTLICYRRDLLEFLNFLNDHESEIINLEILKKLKLSNFS